MKVISREEVQGVAATGGQVIEVLDRDEFAWAHLPGALHLPLRELDEHASHLLDPRRPVVAYCNDFL